MSRGGAFFPTAASFPAFPVLCRGWSYWEGT